MRNRTLTIITSILLGGFLLTLTSCLKDNRDDCPARENVKVTVKVTEGLEGSFDPSAVENVCLFIFDENGYFIQKWSGRSDIHDHLYDISLDLNPGTYTFVVWTNEGDTYQSGPLALSRREPTYQEMIFFLNCPQDQLFTWEIPPLHHGIHTDEVKRGQNDFTVYVTPNTYTVNFTVKGLPVHEHSFDFTIHDDVSSYNFENSIVDDGNDYQHIRSAAFEEEEELHASFRLLSLGEDREPAFGLDNATTQTHLYSGNLVEMIRKAYEAAEQTLDFGSTFEFDIVLLFDSKLGVTIEVNGWDYTQTPGEL